MSDPLDDLTHLWVWFAERCDSTTSPLYGRIGAAVAADRDVLDWIRTSTPPETHLPPALLAAVHYLVLQGADHPLATLYAEVAAATDGTGTSEGARPIVGPAADRAAPDSGALFLDFWRLHRDELAGVLATRRIQTNECARSALIAPAVTWLAPHLQAPMAFVDVGASAGLNLLCDQYRLDYGPHGCTGPIDSPVVIRCAVLGGDPPIADKLPELGARIGIDRSPVDLSDDDDARWLLACIWPDTGRMARASAAIRLGQSGPPVVLSGDAAQALPAVLAGLPAGQPAVVGTTWVFAYFSLDQRREFMALLAEASRKRTVAWLSAEGVGTVEPLQAGLSPDDPRAADDVLGVVLYRNATAEPHLLARVHEHGGWMDWRAAALA